MNNVRETIIIGSGPSGLTAAIYTGRAELKPLVIAGTASGGQLMTTTMVENWPGATDGIMGPKLMMDMQKQAEKFGAEILLADVTRVELEGKIKKVYVGDKEFLSKTVIIATGASPKRLGISSEDKFWGRGVSTCATCDGAFYKEKIVAVIGGGDSAAEESNFVTKFANKVYLLVRGDTFKASKIMQERVNNNSKIEVLFNTEVKDILGDKVVNRLKIFNNKEKTESELAVDGMFLAIGHIPNTKLFKDQLEVNHLGYIKVLDDTNTFTSVEGVFVAGDVKDYNYRQAITAAGMGCMAAIDCEKWLHSQN